MITLPLPAPRSMYARAESGGRHATTTFGHQIPLTRNGDSYVHITVNGKAHEIADGATLADLLVRLELRPEQVAVERNLGIVTKREYTTCVLQPSDGLEIVTLVGGGAPAEDQLDEPLRIGRYSFRSRLMVGTGKYTSFEQMAECLAASGTECVTVAVRRVDLSKRGEKTLLDFIDRKRCTILPNTAGCYTAADALRTARLAREVLGTELVKLMLADKNAAARSAATLEATATLVPKDSWSCVTPPTTRLGARRLEAAGAASVRPRAARSAAPGRT